MRCASFVRLFFIVSLLVIGEAFPLRAEVKAAVSKDLQETNAQVKGIDDLVTAGKLASLETKYRLEEPTEGVPPSFQFFFSSKDGKLRACKIRVGHETWGKSFSYYFGSDEQPLKYRETVSGREDKPEPLAIIYGRQGKILWKNGASLRVPFQEIQQLYTDLKRRSEAFSGY